VTDLPADLIQLERIAEEERARLAGLAGEEYSFQLDRWRVAAEAFQGAVTEYAAREDVTMSRYEVEQAVKKAVRHADEDPAE
jgi:hypothetical protein